MPYDFVGRMENIEADAARVLQQIGQGNTKFPTQHDLKFPPSGASETLAKQLYTADLMFAVRALYAADFDLLGYV